MGRNALAITWGLFLSLTVATQLRPTGGRVGVGELGLALLVLVCLARFVAAPFKVIDSEFAKRVVIAMLAGAGFFASGWLWGIFTEHGDGTAWPSALAFAFAAIVSLSVVAALRLRWLDGESILQVFGATAVSFAALLLVMHMSGFTPLPCEVWYEGDKLRFTGCSENPNQLALSLIPVPFLLLDSVAHGRRRFKVALALSGAIICVVLGFLTGSDALLAAWLAGVTALLTYGFLKLARWRARIAIAICLCASAALLFSIVQIYRDEGGAAEAFVRVEAAVDTNDQATTRLALWYGALESFASSSFVGWGPGAFSIVGEDGLRIEAHNTLLDWGTNAGIGGVVALIAVFVLSVKVLWDGKRPWVFAAVVSIIVFSMFHFVLRQPVFWIYVLVPAAVVASYRQRPKVSGGRDQRTTRFLGTTVQAHQK